jgi:hypothetical protein
VVSAGYVVRGKHKGQHAAISDVDGTSPADRKPNPFGTINEAVTRVVWLGPFGWSDVAIYRVHPDGREERLPSYEEALAMRPAVVLVCRDCGAEVERGQRCKAAGCVDPLAALEAAERRLLEAGGWTVAGRDVYGAERWTHPTWKGGAESLSTALTIERRRLAAKGGA